MSFLKEAAFYIKLSDQQVQCRLCPWQCRIMPGSVGFCRVRKNIDGKLYSLVYGEISSMAADPIEKKPLLHFHPGTKVFSVGTYGCNMRCGHCQNWQISHVDTVDEEKFCIRQENRYAQYLAPEKLIELAKAAGCAGVAWTYNEPTVWFEYTYDTAKLAKAAGLYTVYVTNGYISLEALDMLGPYLEAFRVDIKAFREDVYQKLTKVKNFPAILAAAVRAKKKWGMHVECITNIIPGLNDDKEQLKSLAGWIAKDLGEETPWHVTRFIPHLDYQHLSVTPVETLERAREIGLEAGLKFIYIGNVPGHKFRHSCY